MMTLTKAEERIMQILWDIKKGFIKNIQDEFPDPKPPYNTVSTIVRVLVKKDIVSFNQYGNTYEYYPLISKDEYSKNQMNSLVSNYFNGSFKKVVNFFSESKNLDVNEVDEVMKMLEEIKQKKKSE
ncbi:MAG: BlaI/MecI/CopY family transcriptional regulator [Bacteroidetes bacterium]|nr:BlaI/MecI/CopY family transcriptional regulator [Bacteroidota bacterium]MBT5529030.1 BlaI/MecI/CopY family transcriptional regulator [Cytophagia bacterium]MBT3801499.1 BlaI/MecI/CopY family transcriptional regulator [Bacteroidota bacterium]MBT4339718.1 BlaI/MecI/CopY family transcriptional regulator [Bacteroidota bacterium]MBT4730330.1 BlaI/MecI/CopY family transcriptional regulator [Bacteroidota bacterium]